MLFGPGSYWVTPPWRRSWSFCVSTRPTSPQVCLCVCACVCLSVCMPCVHWQPLYLDHARPLPLSAVSNLTGTLTLSTKGPIVLSSTEQHCVSLYKTSACSPATHNEHSVRIQGSGCNGNWFQTIWRCGEAQSISMLPEIWCFII